MGVWLWRHLWQFFRRCLKTGSTRSEISCGPKAEKAGLMAIFSTNTKSESMADLSFQLGVVSERSEKLPQACGSQEFTSLSLFRPSMSALSIIHTVGRQEGSAPLEISALFLARARVWKLRVKLFLHTLVCEKNWNFNSDTLP